MNSDTIVTGIQAILAPALGISATALLLLGLQNRYSSIINRIRLLNEEKREYSHRFVEKSDMDYSENMRYLSVLNQIEKLFDRCRDVRNSILYIQGSILLFVLTSVSIALNLFFSDILIRNLPLILFSLGMLLVLAGVIYSAKDVVNSYRITEIEVKADE
jgi:hypothetical protein